MRALVASLIAFSTAAITAALPRGSQYPCPKHAHPALPLLSALTVRLRSLGVSTVRQYLRAALIDELHLAIRPVLLGSGEHLLNDIDMRALGYECANHVAGERATHVFLRPRA